MTTIADLLKQAQELGYQVKLSGENIKLTYTKDNQPPKEAVLILNQFKDHKQEVIEYLQKANKPEPRTEVTPEQFEATFLNAVGEINRNYQPGILDFIRQRYPARWNQSFEAENRLNLLWYDGKDLVAFQRAVDEWKEVEIDLIKLFTKDTKDKPLCLKCGSLNCNPYNREN